MESVYGDTIKLILEKCPVTIHRLPKNSSQKNYKRFGSAIDLRKCFKDVRFIDAATEELPMGGEWPSGSGIIYSVFPGNRSFRLHRWGG